MLDEGLALKLQHLANDLGPIKDIGNFCEPMFKTCRHSKMVLIGESTHGTEEFYQIRCALTKRLIEEAGFMAVAIEWDWPEVVPANQYVLDNPSVQSWQQALQGFQRFPDWMWRNKAMVQFLNWLRDYNQKKPDKKFEIYGLDLYSLYASMKAVLNFLKKTDVHAWRIAQNRYANLGDDPQSYGFLASSDRSESCAKEALQQFMELQHNAWYYQQLHPQNKNECFHAIQNARLVKNAEQYYRSLFSKEDISWNIRDKHMFETLGHIANYLESIHDKPAKIIVWCHNSHVGDERATEMGERGQYNIGQLTKENYGPNAALLGFTTFDGTVRAASDWGGKSQVFTINPALQNSFEALFHQLKYKNFFINIQENAPIQDLFKDLNYLHRAIGVVYRPETERQSHYYYSKLGYQYDGLIHIDRTHALEPLMLHKIDESPKELPETFPSGV